LLIFKEGNLQMRRRSNSYNGPYIDYQLDAPIIIYS